MIDKLERVRFDFFNLTNDFFFGKDFLLTCFVETVVVSSDLYYRSCKEG